MHGLNEIVKLNNIVADNQLKLKELNVHELTEEELLAREGVHTPLPAVE